MQHDGGRRAQPSDIEFPCRQQLSQRRGDGSYLNPCRAELETQYAHRQAGYGEATDDCEPTLERQDRAPVFPLSQLTSSALHERRGCE